MEHGTVAVQIDQAVATLTFSHPKGNCLPRPLLSQFKEALATLGKEPRVRAIVLQSTGDSTFCAGASFDEFKAVKNFDEACEFFQGIARVVLAMKRCPKPIVTRVQGKAVGGGVGLVAASDYVIAHNSASIRLSELAIGIGPFLIGPAVERKVGRGAFQGMALDADWRSAEWALKHDLYHQLHSDAPSLDSAVSAMAARFAAYHEDAVRELKRVLWEDTEHWEDLVLKRAEITSRLVLTEFVQKAVRSIT